MSRLPREALERARDRTIPDVLAPGLDILFCGINPSLTSGATGWHFAHPGNRFWRVLFESGLTPTLLSPDRQAELLSYGLGITNLVARATARADEVGADELRAGGRRLRRLVGRQRPAWVAVVGVTAYRTAFDEPATTIGPQPEPLGTARLWVLPNPSGLNAHYTPATLAAEFARLREAAGRVPG
jgi:TDG/mug DNA glycosylase family protein